MGMGSFQRGTATAECRKGMVTVWQTAGVGLMITVFADQRKIICATAGCSLMGLRKNAQDPA
jgi:hypothetical protein